jgi:hypothetical protein
MERAPIVNGAAVVMRRLTTTRQRKFSKGSSFIWLSRKRMSGCRKFWVRPGAAGRGVYPLCMPELSSVPPQWPVSGEQISSGVASRRPIPDVRRSC